MVGHFCRNGGVGRAQFLSINIRCNGAAAALLHFYRKLLSIKFCVVDIIFIKLAVIGRSYTFQPNKENTFHRSKLEKNVK